MKKQPNSGESPTKNENDTQESSPNKQKIKNRKIPQTLIQPYDLVTLHETKKKRFNFKKSESKQENFNNSELQKLKPLFGECYCSEDLKQQQTETIYQLTATLLVLSKVCSIRIRSIEKIKLIGESQAESTVLHPTILKVTWGDNKQQSNNIFVKLNTNQEGYFLFASIISRKLLLQDFTLIDLCKKQIKNFNTGITKIEGEIYKISTFMRKWQKKQAKLDDKLKFYKQQKLNQQIKNLKQIWTRFSMHNGYFVVKMFEGIQKIQLGIPLSDYCNIQSERNWLYLLFKLIQ